MRCSYGVLSYTFMQYSSQDRTVNYVPALFHLSMLTTKETGILGEEMATQYLLKNGYEVRERNVRFGKFEIDIVAYDPVFKMIVFVEVKARTNVSDSYPIHSAMHRRKRISMKRAVARWIMHHQYDGPSRIDVLSVSHRDIVEHLKNFGSDFY